MHIFGDKFFTFCLLLLSATCSAQYYALKKKADTTLLMKRVPEMLDSAQITGLSLAIVHQGKLYWHKGFGLANQNSKKPIHDSTVFEAASLSKPLFAYIVLQLVEQKVLDLDKPLVQYVGDAYIEKVFLGHKITDTRFRRITARMCLSHATGFPNGRYGSLKIAFNPGSDLSYSGEGFTFLQRVVEQLTGKSLQDLAQELVFLPLDMRHSSYIWQEHLLPQMADGHGSQGAVGGFRRQAQPMGAYSLIATAEDLGKFLAALLNQEGLHPQTFKEMWKVQSTAKAGMLKGMSWGLGLGVFQSKAGKAFWHWGDFGTFKAYLVGFPEQKTGLVFLSNSANGLNVGLALSHLAIGGEHLPFYTLPYTQYDTPENQLWRVAMREGLLPMVDLLNVYKLRKDPRLGQQTLNQVGHLLLKNGKAALAFECFKMNVLVYPQWFAAYDSLGEAYLALGNQLGAKQCWSRSLELNPKNWEARRRLRSLE